MRAFPPRSDLANLIGQTLNQIALDPYQTQFLFDRTTIVSALGVEHVEPDGEAWKYDCVSWEGGPILLHRLVNKRIVEISHEELRLTLHFENGATLAILSDLGPYEAGQIAGDGQFVVF